MRKAEVALLLAETGKIARESEFFLIGSQALHGWSEEVPAEVLVSQECDIYPRHRVEAVALLEQKLGRHSPFATSNGYYADVVTPEIATLPQGWESRLKAFPCSSVTAL